MTETLFEWDERKNAINKAKHGVSFEEAISVFDDTRALVIPDPDHSDHTGNSAECYCEHGDHRQL